MKTSTGITEKTRAWPVARFAVSILLTIGLWPVLAQQPNQNPVPDRSACAELHRLLQKHAANGQLEEAERAAFAAQASGANFQEPSCAAVILPDLAAIMQISGRIDEAEVIAGQCLKTLEKSYPSDDPVLLRPLYALAVARFEQGKIGGAREAFRRMQSIRAQTANDRALVHGMAAALLDREGSWKEAESEVFRNSLGI